MKIDLYCVGTYNDDTKLAGCGLIMRAYFENVVKQRELALFFRNLSTDSIEIAAIYVGLLALIKRVRSQKIVIYTPSRCICALCASPDAETDTPAVKQLKQLLATFTNLTVTTPGIKEKWIDQAKDLAARAITTKRPYDSQTHDT